MIIAYFQNCSKPYTYDSVEDAEYRIPGDLEMSGHIDVCQVDEVVDGKIVASYVSLWNPDGPGTYKLSLMATFGHEPTEKPKKTEKPTEKPFLVTQASIRKDADSVLENLGVKKGQRKKLLDRAGSCSSVEEMIEKCFGSHTN